MTTNDTAGGEAGTEIGTGAEPTAGTDEQERILQDDAGGSGPRTPEGSAHGSRYWRFTTMIATSMTAMFALTYSNTYRLADVKWSETRFYMTS